MVEIKTTPKKYWVYFVRGGPCIKIGITKDMDARMKGLIAQSPIRPELLLKIPGSRELEKHFHRLFARHVDHGEWFREHQEIYDAIQMLKPETIAPPRSNLW